MNKDKDPYKLPAGYFDKLQSEVMAQTKLPDTSGFNIPNGYFDKMQHQVIQKVKPKEPKVVNMWSKSWYSAAASLVAVCCVGIWMWSSGVESQDNLLADVSDSSAIEYLVDDELSLDQYAMMLDESEIESIFIEEDEDDLDLLDESELLELEEFL